MALCCERSQDFFFYQHHLSFSNEPNPKLNLRTVINNNKISLWLQPEMYPCKRTNTVQNRRGYPCRVAMNQATVTLVFSPIRLNHATMPPPFKYPPCFHAHACAETTHIPNAKRASKAFSSGTLLQIHFTHTRVTVAP